MLFEVSHRTTYRYSTPAFESVAELRMAPLTNAHQRVDDFRLTIEPSAPIRTYRDFFGNRVDYFSLPFRHEQLEVVARATVETRCAPNLEVLREVTVDEARQIQRSQLNDYFPYLQRSAYVPTALVAEFGVPQFFVPGGSLTDAAWQACQWIYDNFTYAPGTTEVNTPLREVFEKKVGVCQDYAHLLLAICRFHRIPCRYVSGYIEAFDPTVAADEPWRGAAATHAWVEVALPGGVWWGLDPTNRQIVGERHIKTAVGRDYADVAPMRGTFNGAPQHQLDVAVEVQRLTPQPAQG
ncbi:MAG: transglutaminase domain-containing protein [Puniceicoccaceae bacterium 5H]|nr:MAG: transglutaminase domain-containing protein [Puniceicoccaceae bacterium 5H]